MAGPLSTRSLVLSFTGLCMVHLVASIDATALSVALPTIARAFGATATEAFWTGTAFILASAVLQPPFAALSHAFGRRAMVLVALALFAEGTIICGTAASIAALLAGRAVQGAGCGGMLALSQVIIADLFPLHRRPLAISLIGLVWLVGTSSGPVMGGGFSQDVTWRWIFWFCLPFVGVASVLIAAFLRTPHRALHPVKALRSFDWIGAGIFIASLTSLLVAITWGGTMFPWSSYQTLLPLVIGLVGIMAFVVYERRPARPMIPGSVFRSKTAVAAFIGQFLMGVDLFAMIYFLPLYYEVAQGYKPLIAGAAIIPNCISSGVATAFAGKFIANTGSYRAAIWLGWAMLSLGTGLLVLLNASTSVPAWIFINICCGIGTGVLFSGLPIACMAPQSDADQATAAGLNTFFRTVGNAFGIAIGNAVYQNELRRALLQDPSVPPALRSQAARIARNAETLRALVRAQPPDSPARAALTIAFVRSLRALWWTLMAVALLGGALALLMRAYGLRRAGSPADAVPLTATDGANDTAAAAARRRAASMADALPGSPGLGTPEALSAWASTEAVDGRLDPRGPGRTDFIGGGHGSGESMA